MMYNNLFNPNYKCDPDSREWSLRYIISYDLKHIIELCHKEYFFSAKNDLEQFRGKISYALSVKDIDEMTWYFLYGITKQIATKYHLY